MTAEPRTSLLQLDDGDYTRFHALAQQLTGMVFAAHRRPELERAVAETLQCAHLPTLTALYARLQQAPVDDPVRIKFIRHLAVGETHFFRNEPQFTALAQHILPEIIERKRPQRQLRIWSAGCATGEEPFSVAILLERLLPDLADWNVLLLATDINQEALARAEQGVYGAWSFRQAPPAFQLAYFTQTGRNYTLLPRIRQRVTFAYLNLAGSEYPSPLTNTTDMDLILCRNVMIYFAPTTTQQVVQHLHAALADGGWLIVGHAEPSQEVFRQFTLYNFPDTVVYRKQAAEPARPSPAPPAEEWPWPTPVSRPPAPPDSPHDQPARDRTPAPTVPPTLRQPPAPPLPQPRTAGYAPTAPLGHERYARALALTAAGEYDEACRLLLTLAAAPVSDGIAAYHLAQLLAGRGKLAEAERWVQVAAERAPLLAEAHYLHSLLLLEAGQPDAALTALRRCIYVDAEFELAHFSLARLYLQQQQQARALRELQLTVSLLAGRPEAELLRGSEGFSVGRLRQIVATQASALSAAT